MPTDPLRMPPKRSLGIFKGLGEVLDKRKQRQIADEDRQQKLEDRVFGSIRQGQQDMANEEMRTLEKALGEERLAAMRRPPMVQRTKVTDHEGRVHFVDPNNPPPDLREMRPPEPLEVVMRNGRRVLLPRSQAAGMEAPAPADNTLVQVQQPDGSVTYIPRQQAAGQQAPSRIGTSGADKAKRVQALANVSDALDGFEQTLRVTGSVVKPGVDKSTLQTTYENVQLQMKELFNLGVLNGPDLLLMRRILNDPTEVKGRALAGGSGDEQTKRAMAQVQQVRAILKRYQDNLAEGNNALPAIGGGRAGGGGPGMGAPKPPASPDPEFDALMAKYQRPPV